MKGHEKLILAHLKRMYPDYVVAPEMPVWLKKHYWRPDFVLNAKRGKMIIGVDVLLSGAIPRFQYTNIVRRLLETHSALRVLIVTLEDSYEDNPEIEEFCRMHGIGLKIIVAGIGLQTVVRTDLDPQVLEAQLVQEKGWFPSPILEQAKGLDKLVFGDIIEKFIENVTGLGDNEDKTRKLVFETINELVGKHSSFNENLRAFMQLARFEEIFRVAPPSGNEHVFHSFRVFLAGCPVINRFYDNFRSAHERFCIGVQKDISVEYAWLLTAIFHDIGRPKEKAAEVVKILQEELRDEDLDVSVAGKETRWARKCYIEARRVLGSLGAFVACNGGSHCWDGGIIEDVEGEKISTSWINIYDEMRSHAVISALDFLAHLFTKASASSERKYRPFVITHGAPAALAILLHDWKIWKPEARSWGLYPINAFVLPLAALLIYIDTWDDYKRGGSDPRIYIKDYSVNGKGAVVTVEWGNSQELNKDKIKYIAYKQALDNLQFELKIKAGMAGEV